MRESLAAGTEAYDSLLNLCVWAKDNGGMGSFYRSQHELVFVWKSGQGSQSVQLVADALLDASALGEIVLDPFLGSGSTLLAAERVGRVCYGIEMEPRYVDLAIRRWQQYTGEQAVHAVTV